MIFTVELKKDYALRILEDLQLMDAITLKLVDQTQPEKKKTFRAVRINTKGFTFNREEANARR
ncbi:MAG: hypothetical protein H7Z75_20575 [Ferruginibacter sp.]|nr:hypothetical protein [Cytophagales bacterium]